MLEVSEESKDTGTRQTLGRNRIGTKEVDSLPLSKSTRTDGTDYISTVCSNNVL